MKWSVPTITESEHGIEIESDKIKVMMFGGTNQNNSLQSTLSAASTDSTLSPVYPHHPLTCSDKLYFNEDNSFGCEHVTVPEDDPRTRFALKSSVATLIIELVYERYGSEFGR